MTKTNSTNTLDDAIMWATALHADQIDKLGRPYILHPLHVMCAFESYEHKNRLDLMVIAVLHDVLEDTWVSEDHLRSLFSKTVVDAVEALTKREGEKYFDYLERVSQNKLATLVKIEDINHNLLKGFELAKVNAKEAERLAVKYGEALGFLKSRI